MDRFKINRPYLYRVIKPLRKEKTVLLESGVIKVVDKKNLIYHWGMEKKRSSKLSRELSPIPWERECIQEWWKNFWRKQNGREEIDIISWGL